jgi:hypothetical protein
MTEIGAEQNTMMVVMMPSEFVRAAGGALSLRRVCADQAHEEKTITSA